jgi:hypothetical protein
MYREQKEAKKLVHFRILKKCDRSKQSPIGGNWSILVTLLPELFPKSTIFLNRSSDLSVDSIEGSEATSVK